MRRCEIRCVVDVQASLKVSSDGDLFSSERNLSSMASIIVDSRFVEILGISLRTNTSEKNIGCLLNIVSVIFPGLRRQLCQNPI